ncbi:MAG: ATP-binding protein, partial [Caldilineaceae bacterium]
MCVYLPVQTTPFIGRQRELADTVALLDESECRLLTILGPGGIGKTRLAIEVGKRMEGRYADGVVYADLASLTEDQYLPETIALAVGLQLVGENAAQQLVDYLAEKELLILLDNFEHLLDGAQLVSEILREAPHVRCLATSREVLNLQEEWLYRVSGLSFPTANAGVQESSEWEAVQFFVERARRMRHNFDAEADLDDIVRICQLVEGTPLAIELAAAWARSMSPRAIASEIGEGLDLLTTSMRNVPERHRSMHAALERSWQSLDEPEKRVLAQLSVFRGGFRRKQAEAVARATLPLLANLVDRSLLRWEADGRYTMHELVRHFASEKLAESPDAESQALTRHADAFAAFLDQRREAVYGLRHYEVLEEIRPELANVRAALQWGLTHAMLDT